jgi:hypothetical protein
VEGNNHGEAYTAIVRGGLLSRVSSNIVEAEAFSVVEGDPCGTVMRGGVALPRSKTPITYERIASEPGRSHVWPVVASRSGPHRKGEEL